jgi:hypothetical protein
LAGQRRRAYHAATARGAVSEVDTPCRSRHTAFCGW